MKEMSLTFEGGGGGTVDYFEQFCAISKVPMVLIKEITKKLIETQVKIE